MFLPSLSTGPHRVANGKTNKDVKFSNRAAQWEPLKTTFFAPIDAALEATNGTALEAAHAAAHQAAHQATHEATDWPTL